MKRREFITLLGGAAATWPLVGHAQQPSKLPLVGYLGVTTATSQTQTVAAFVQRLSELGWIEGRTAAIEFRWAEGRNERFSEITAEFVRLKADVIVTSGAGAAAAKQVTSMIPIVFSIAADPIGSGLVMSLARPGGNVTGLSAQQTDLAGKRIELLREAVPSFRRLAVLANIGNATAALEMEEAQAAAKKIGLPVLAAAIRRAEDIGSAFDAMEGRADALYVCGDPLQFTHRIRINTLALGLRLPTIVPRRGPEPRGTLSPSRWRRGSSPGGTSR